METTPGSVYHHANERGAMTGIYELGPTGNDRRRTGVIGMLTLGCLSSIHGQCTPRVLVKLHEVLDP